MITEQIKKIRNLSYYAYAALITIILFWLLCVVRINPGNVGIVVNPFGQNKGVEKEELTIGIHILAPWKTVYKFPTYEQNWQWTDKGMFTFQTSEGLPVDAEIGITYHLEQSKIPELFAKYRKGMEEITELYVKNILRDHLNKLSSKIKIEDLFSTEKEKLFNEIHSKMNSELNHVGIITTNIYIIGRLHVPQVVTEALNKKIEATQKAQQRENELRESEAEARKLVAKAKGQAESLIIEAESKAKANIILNKSLTPELLKLKHIDKWNGQLPNTVAGNDSNVLLNVK